MQVEREITVKDVEEFSRCSSQTDKYGSGIEYNFYLIAKDYTWSTKSKVVYAERRKITQMMNM